MGTDKLSLTIGNKTILEHTVGKFNKEKIIIARGGETRQKTLEKAVSKLRGNPLIIIHNAANPNVTRAEIDACIRAAKKYGAAYVGHRAHDTIHDNKTGQTLNRKNLIIAQTPQAAYLKDIKKALALGIGCTDEVELLEKIGIKAKFVPASPNNFKITTWADYEYFKYLANEQINGIGEDAHIFNKGRGLMLGGIFLPKEESVEANSDGDILIHALINAIQSALGRKSLGSFADKMYAEGEKRSIKYLAEILPQDLRIREIRFSIESDKPKIDPISDRIKRSLQKLTGCKKIGITATTGNRISNRFKCTCLVTLTSNES